MKNGGGVYRLLGAGSFWRVVIDHGRMNSLYRHVCLEYVCHIDRVLGQYRRIVGSESLLDGSTTWAAHGGMWGVARLCRGGAQKYSALQHVLTAEANTNEYCRVF